MKIEQEPTIDHKSTDTEGSDGRLSSYEESLMTIEPPETRTHPLELLPDDEGGLEPDEVVLIADFSQQQEPLTIRVSRKVLDRAGEFFQERRLTIKIAGGVAIVAAAAATGLFIKKHIDQRRERKERPIPVLTDEQRKEFGKVYQDHLVPICTYIYLRVGDAEDTEDLAQRVFEQAFMAFPRFRPIPGLEDPYRPWLFKIAHNFVANFLRDRGRRPEELPLEEELMPAPPEEAPKEPSEEVVRMMQAIHSLKDEEQLIVWLKSLELSNKEIGMILGRSKGAIKSSYHRIWEKIRKGVLELEKEDSLTI